MKIKFAGLLGGIMAMSLVANGLASPREFSLDRYATPAQRVLNAGRPIQTAGSPEYPLGAEGKKRPWIAALETFSINMGTWLIDRYVFNKSYTYITWASIKDNFRLGWVWDDDLYAESFAGHPYQGSQFYNAARSLGLSVWESIPYAAVGYFMWGFFLENDQPSINDHIFDVLGGLNLGEVEYRLSSQVLDDSATGGERVGREILAFLIDPIRGFNRIVYGDMFRTSPVNHQAREPMSAQLTLEGMLVSKGPAMTNPHFSPSLNFDMLYGVDSSDIVTDHPFDLLVFNGEVRYASTPSRGFVTFSMYGPWYAKEWEGRSGQHHAFGVFQHYDYLNNEAFQMGGTSTTAGLVSVWPLGGGIELKSSIQAGVLLLGGTRTDNISLQGERDYDYAVGFTGKVDLWLSHPTLGSLSLHFKHFRGWSIEATERKEADDSRDINTLFTARYSYPISKTWGVCLDYGRSAIRQHFVGHPEGIRDSSRVGLGLQLLF